jgi:hypothetical protein
MAAQMIPAVKMILEARNWIMAQNYISVIVFNFHVFSNLYKALLKIRIMNSIMVALNENFLTIQFVKHFNCFSCLTPKHIT